MLVLSSHPTQTCPFDAEAQGLGLRSLPGYTIRLHNLKNKYCLTVSSALVGEHDMRGRFKPKKTEGNRDETSRNTAGLSPLPEQPAAAAAGPDSPVPGVTMVGLDGRKKKGKTASVTCHSLVYGEELIVILSSIKIMCINDTLFTHMQNISHSSHFVIGPCRWLLKLHSIFILLLFFVLS